MKKAWYSRLFSFEKNFKIAIGRMFFGKKLRTVAKAQIRQLADRSSILLFATN
jgi:hypothetical protein